MVAVAVAVAHDIKEHLKFDFVSTLVEYTRSALLFDVSTQHFTS